MGNDYKPVFMDVKDQGYFEKENKGILKKKLTILLVAIIAYQGYVFIQKRHHTVDSPPSAEEIAQAMKIAANGGTLTPEQMAKMGQHMTPDMLERAKAEAQEMMRTGDTLDYQDDVRNDPLASQIMGFE